MKIGREIRLFSPVAMEALCQYLWPGNIRELMNVIERAVLLCRSDIISIDNLPDTVQGKRSASQNLPLFNEPKMNSWKDKTLAQVKEQVLCHVEKRYLEMILEQTRGRVGEAADIAGIHPRGLYGKMKKLGLDKNHFK
jgi:two-component system response regulator AtoC